MTAVAHGDVTFISPNKGFVVTWTPLTNANTVGSSFEVRAGKVQSVQIAGTFDSATVILEGSNDGTNWASLADPQGTAISKTSAAIEQILEHTRYIRPNSSGGSSSQSITVSVLVTL